MKIFLSAISDSEIDFFIRSGVKMKWNLVSFDQIYQMSEERGMAFFNKLLQHSEEILIDSGAHSFQFGKKVNWDEYTEAYCDFIRKVDCPKIIGYFEMDVDNIIGYDKVLALRRKIEQVTDKVIPVWHNTRGIADYKAMCQEYAGKIVSITGFKKAEFRDEQYPMFLNEAWKNKCRIHCLGMTRKEVMDKVPFDYTDSASWKLQHAYGMNYNPKTGKWQKVCKASTSRRNEGYMLNYIGGQAMQEHYYLKWRKYNGHYNNDWSK